MTTTPYTIEPSGDGLPALRCTACKRLISVARLSDGASLSLTTVTSAALSHGSVCVAGRAAVS
jgi:hypothetical protein